MNRDEHVKVCWVGGIPAHYTRAMHVRLDEIFPKNIKFLYLKKQNETVNRDYQCGKFPELFFNINSHDWVGIWRYLEKSSPQIVILAGFYHRFILIALFWAVLRKRHIAYWGDTNIQDFYKKGIMGRLFEIIRKRLVYKYIDTYFYIGSRNRDFYQCILGEKCLDKIFVKVPYPALINTASKTSIKDNKVRLLYIGRLIPIKGVDNLIKALSILPSNVRDRMLLTIIGDGSEYDRLLVLTKKLGLTNQIKFHGSIPSNKTAVEYAKNDFFVLPSYSEPWGLVVNEALSAGLPVIAPYWVGAVADLVIDGFTGVVMNDNKPETIMQAIIKTINLSKQELKNMGEQGHQLVKYGGFTLDGATKNIVNYIQQTII